MRKSSIQQTCLTDDFVWKMRLEVYRSISIVSLIDVRNERIHKSLVFLLR